MTKTSKLRWLMIAGLVAVFGLSACDRKEREEAKQDAEQTMENVGEKADDLMDKAKEPFQGPGEEAGEKIDDATGAAGEKAEDLGEKLDEKTEEMKSH